MLKKTVLEQIAGLLKMDPAKFVEAATATEEKDIEVTKDLQVFTKTDLDTRDRAKYGEGKTAGQELIVKDLKKKKGIETDSDDLEKVVEAIETKAVETAKIPPNEQLKEKDKEIEKYKNASQKASEKAAKLELEKADAALDSKLLRHFPKERNSTITDEEYLALIKSRVKFTEKDGKEIVSIDGKTMEKADTFEPIPLGDALKGYFTERKWIEAPAGGGGSGGSGGGGRGGGNSGGQGIPRFTKLSEVQKYATDNGINFQGSEGVALMKKAYADNPQLDTTK
jgi:hypothetical protein